MTCQDCEELAGAYALDAVTSAEREAVEEHFAACPDCMRMVRELQSVASLLPLTVPAVRPSPLVKERILASIQAEAPQPAIPLQERPQRRKRTQWRHWPRHLIAVAAVLVFALLGSVTAWNISLQQQIASLSSSRQPSVSYAIKGTSDVPDATGQLIYFPRLNVTVLMVHGLPQTSGNQVYQGWLLRCKQPTSIGLLTMRDGVATGDFQGDVKSYDTTAVSLEPGPLASKDAPKGALVAVGSLLPSTAATGCHS